MRRRNRSFAPWRSARQTRRQRASCAVLRSWGLQPLHPLALSHFCLANCLGAGLDATLAAIMDAESGLRPCAFDTVNLPTYVGEVRGLEALRLRADLAEYDCRNNRLAQLALEQDGFIDAVAATAVKYGSDRIAVVLGTSTSGIHETELDYRRRDSITGALPNDFCYQKTHSTSSVAEFVSRHLSLTGPAVVVSSACSSSAQAFGVAARMIEAGLCDAAVVGGADSLCLTTLYGFHSLELVSDAPCRPFDIARKGISIGEAAGFALLEKVDQRGEANALLLLGVGESSDAHHMSTPHPEGLGARLAMERALAAAGVGPQAIDYINLHGTATLTNDAAEDRAVFALFGADTPCSSTKGFTGHALGAAGINEVIISALSIRHNIIPGSAHTRTVDPALRSRYVIERRRGRVERVLSNSFGFGGSNCSLILGRAV
jgi:3-oxoacyl-[acyl-carrier-protein] synthase-1